MILTFNEHSLENIRAGEKNTTIRKNWKRWVLWWTHPNSSQVVDVWRGNPRSGGTKLAPSRIDAITVCYGRDLDVDDAMRDGFEKVGDLRLALSKLHRMTIEEVARAPWAVLHFDPEPIRRALGEG